MAQLPALSVEEFLRAAEQAVIEHSDKTTTPSEDDPEIQAMIDKLSAGTDPEPESIYEYLNFD